MSSSSCSRKAALSIGLGAAAVYLLLAVPRLEGPGPQYDEMHQAPAAFAWVGSSPSMVCSWKIGRFCVLDMPYSVAFKGNLYGAYMRLFGRGFSLRDWRLLGVGVVALALLLFALAARTALSAAGLALFLALTVSDVTLFVHSRFDYGPVALGLALRLILVAVWLRGVAAPEPSAGNSFGLASIAGLATCEKLSSVVLLVPVALALSGRRSRCHLLAAASGWLVGTLPLLVVNLVSLGRGAGLVSLRDVGTSPSRSLVEFGGWAWDTLALGAGRQAVELLLGPGVPGWAVIAEVLLIPLALGLAVAAAPGRWRRPVAMAAGAYVTMALAVWLLPRVTRTYHWVLATPFQYAAVALAVRRREARRWVVAAFAIVLGLWLGARVAGVVRVERAVLAGRSGLAWHPSLRELGEFAATRAEEAAFLATDWGVAVQLYCYLDGRDGLIFEPYWNYRGPQLFTDIRERTGRGVIYALRLRDVGVRPGTRARIEQDLAADPAWREVACEPEASGRAVACRKFVAVPRG
jgi:hypothetical protein